MNVVRAKGTALRTGKDSNLTVMRALSCRPAAFSAFLPMLVWGLGVGQSARCYAQTQAGAQTKVAVLGEPLPSDTGTANSAAPAAARPAAKPEPEVSVDIAKELAVMKARIEQLETQLKSRDAAELAPVPAAAPTAKVTDTAPIAAPANPAAPVAEQAAATPAKPEKPAAPAEPFAYADWTWLNGNPRNKDVVWDSKFFTPEIRMDTSIT